MSNVTRLCYNASYRFVPAALRTLLGRRLLVAGSFAVGIATVAAGYYDLDYSLVMLLGICSSILLTMVWGAINALTDRPDVDERERGVRDEAYRLSFTGFAWLGYPVLIGLVVAWPEERHIMQNVWAWTAGWAMVWGLPSAVIAWTQPDED